MTGSQFINIEEVTLSPQRVAPGGVIRVTPTISNGAHNIGNDDPDRCEPNAPTPEGSLVNVTVTTNWGEQQSQTVCVPILGFGAINRKPSFDFKLPEGVRSGLALSVSACVSGGCKESGLIRPTVVEGGSEGPDGNGNGSAGENLLRWAVDNPVIAAGAGVGGLIIIRTVTTAATETVLGGA